MKFLNENKSNIITKLNEYVEKLGDREFKIKDKIAEEPKKVIQLPKKDFTNFVEPDMSKDPRRLRNRNKISNLFSEHHRMALHTQCPLFDIDGIYVNENDEVVAFVERKDNLNYNTASWQIDNLNVLASHNKIDLVVELGKNNQNRIIYTNGVINKDPEKIQLYQKCKYISIEDSIYIRPTSLEYNGFLVFYISDRLSSEYGKYVKKVLNIFKTVVYDTYKQRYPIYEIQFRGNLIDIYQGGIELMTIKTTYTINKPIYFGGDSDRNNYINYINDLLELIIPGDKYRSMKFNVYTASKKSSTAMISIDEIKENIRKILPYYTLKTVEEVQEVLDWCMYLRLIEDPKIKINIQ